MELSKQLEQTICKATERLPQLDEVRSPILFMENYLHTKYIEI